MGSIVSAITGSGAKDAASAQAGAAADAIVTQQAALSQQIKLGYESLTLQMDMLDKALAVGDPYRDAGSNAMAVYESMLYGVPTEQTASYRAAEIDKIRRGSKTKDQFAAEMYGDYWKDGNGDGWGGIPNNSGYQEDVDRLYSEQEEAINAQIAELDSKIGETAGQRIDPMSVVRDTPGYDFRMDEGQKALERSAASRSGVLSGAQLKATERYGQDYATNEYNQYLNRLGGPINTGASVSGAQSVGILNSANSQSGVLQGMGNAYGVNAQNVGSLQTQIGAAQASGYLGEQAAGTNLLNTAASFAGATYGGSGWGA